MLEAGQGKWIKAGVILLLLVAVLGWLEVVELRAEEPRRAVVAIEMHQSGNWVSQSLLGESYYNKPPLYSWVLSSSYWITGRFSEFAVRLPGVLSFLFTGLILLLYSRKYLGSQKAWIATFGWLTCFALLFYGTVNAGEIDLFYALVVMLQVLSIFHFAEKKLWWRLFLFSYALTVVGLLTKGIPSLLFQGITLVAWLAATRQFKKLISFQHLAGIGLLAVLVGGYFYLYDQQDNIAHFLTKQVSESSQRSFNESSGVQMLTSIVKFPLLWLLHLLPLGLAVILLFWKKYRLSLKENAFLRFCWIFILSNIVLYWIQPGFVARYTYMFIPFFMVICAHLLVEWLQNQKYISTLFVVLASLILIGALANFALPLLDVKFAKLDLITGILIGLILSALSFFVWKQRKEIKAIWFVFAAIIILRISFNEGILPISHSKINSNKPYRELAKELAHQTEGKPLDILGKPLHFYPKVSILNTVLYQDTFLAPQNYPYQLPYYYFLETGNVMGFEQIPVKDALYLGYEKQLNYYKNINILRTFQTSINKNFMQLVEGE